MDSRTRVLKALRHEKPDRAPFNFWMDRRLMERYEQRIGNPNWRVTHYGADVIEAFALLAFPTGPGVERDGTRWQTGPAMESWDDVNSLELPDPTADAVYDWIRRDLDAHPDVAIFLDMPTPWGVIAGIRSYELIYTDMMDEPDRFKELARRIADIQTVAVERALDMGVTALYLMEDLATTAGLSMSPAMIQEFCLDFCQDQAAAAKSRDVPILWHSDGNTIDLIEHLLPLGVQAINPLQYHLHDYDEFKSRFGDRVALYGGLDNCFVIPDGTPEEVSAQVLDVFEKIGRPDGALILSSHDIPLHTPEENVEEMVRTITEECVYQ
ncbi:MAG: hypothetical protein GF320_00720 [Armatimonadia bacterium]|nr:hypothetical protein [Armatimonadia bacterium]